ncbi:MAG TPA: hypothetical protein VGN93_13355 [Shinella sp.]|jgi:hypothetical protein|uniref:hypothetical protein n=1 Tax=Shinella sp. TaxID=1870904 RepID=UPI002E166604|nr:hypothetical protein [Shinella sp.]
MSDGLFLFKDPNTVMNSAIDRATGERDANAVTSAIEVAFFRPVRVTLEDEHGISRSYSIALPANLWAVDLLLTDGTRVPMAYSPSQEDVQGIAVYTQNQLKPNGDIPILDAAGTGSA